MRRTHTGDVPDLAALGAAVERELRDRRLTRAWLARKLSKDPSWVSRLVSGKTRDIQLGQVVAIEDHLECERGLLLRAGNFVKCPTDTREALSSAPELPPKARARMLALYELESTEPSTTQGKPSKRTAAPRRR